MTRLEQQNKLAKDIGRLLRESFGKGPQSIFVTLQSPFVVIHLKNFLSRAEKILLHQNQASLVHKTRGVIMEYLMPEMKSYLHLITGMNVQEFCYDWELESQSGVLIGIEPNVEELAPFFRSYTGQEALHHEIRRRIAGRVNQDEIHSCMINEKTILLVLDNRKVSKRNLINKMMRNIDQVELTLQAKIVDMFTTSICSLNKSVIVFILG